MTAAPRRRLLLADRDEAMRAWIKRTLAFAGCDVAEASSGFELLDRLADDGPYDLVITEVGRAEPRQAHPTGLQVATMAREAGLATPFLVMAESPDSRLSEVLSAVGRARLLSKPFSPHALLAAVRGILSLAAA